jgi:tetratricopeptide (TPR) repeat protein
LRDYETALQIYPNSAGSQLGRGDALADLGRSQQALDAYAEAIRVASDDRWRLPRWIHDEVVLARARADRNELIVITRIRRGKLHQKLGRRDDALAEYTEALRVLPNHARVYVNRGWFHEKAGEMELARADYEKAAALRVPDDWLVRALHRTR